MVTDALKTFSKFKVLQAAVHPPQVKMTSLIHKTAVKPD